MAFMMPVVRNNWDIHGGSRPSSKNSSCPRSRQVSECKSDNASFSSTPHSDLALNTRARSGMSPRRFGSGGLQCSATDRNYHLRLASANSARLSRLSLPTSPSRNVSESLPASEGTSPPKATESQNALVKFHARLINRLRRKLKLPSDDTSDSAKGNPQVTNDSVAV